MDEKSFALVQAVARAAAAECVVSFQTQAIRFFLSQHSDESRSLILKAIGTQILERKDHYLSVAMRDYPAEYSDLIAGEFQEAFERITSEVKMKLGI